MAEEKKPGIFKDPWRQNVKPVVPEPASEPVDPATATYIGEEAPLDSGTDDIQHDVRASVLLKGYGGVALLGTDSPKKVAVQIINCCAEYEPQMGDTLAKYGIVVAQLEEAPDMTMYIRRRDGWTLCIPDARTREEGLLQLIQALLEIDSDPNLKPYLRKFGLTPFKL